MTPRLHIDGRIERRLLVNLRIDPDAVRWILPSGLRPQIVEGWSVAGLCCIRLAALRPRGLPLALGFTTENVAHRIAVEWEDDGVVQRGVWIPSRCTSSRLTAAAGGRLFPAVHARARFAVHDTGDEITIEIADRRRTVLTVACRRTTAASDGLFPTVDAAQQFFQQGSIGLSPSRREGRYDLVDLSVPTWHLERHEVIDARSMFFDAALPPGTTAEWDSAFVMRSVSCAWRGSTTHTPTHTGVPVLAPR